MIWWGCSILKVIWLSLGINAMKLVAKLQDILDFASFRPLQLVGDASVLSLEMSEKDQAYAKRKKKSKPG